MLKGSDIKFLKSIIRLIIIDVIFGLLPIFLYELELLDYFVYYGVLIIMSVGCSLYSYGLLHISSQSSKRKKKTLKKLHKAGLYQLGNSPVFSTSKSDGYGSFAKELYFTCQEKQRELFENKGYVIIVGSKDELKKFSTRRFISGYFSRVDKYIMLFTDCETSEKKPYDIKIVTKTDFSRTFYHEWGHFVDFANDYVSETFGFLRYFNGIKRHYKQSVRLLCSGMPSLYFRKYPKIDLYELVSSSEYFASYYSIYRRESTVSKYLRNTFDKLEGIENVACCEKGKL